MLKNNIISHFLLFLFLIANVCFWMYSKSIQTVWLNVPPVPRIENASITALGDKALAYRGYAMMLQNLGDVGGRKTSLKQYNFSKLKKWFFLEDALDSHSDAVPMLATFYYGAVADNEKINHVLDYLSVVGQNPEGSKWRWLGHGVFLARDVMKDHDRALELAYILADNKSPNLGNWAKQLPVFLLYKGGETDLAYKIMLNILISNVDTMHPTEIFFMQDYICNTLLKEKTHITPPIFCE